MAVDVSLLPTLEPLLGVGIALNLAYIGLERFRYRKTIRANTEEVMGDLKDAPPRIRSMNYHKCLMRLTSLEDELSKPQRSLKHIREMGWVASHVYAIWFEKHVDLVAVSILAFFAFLLLTLGIGHAAQSWTLFSNAFSMQYFHLWHAASVAICAVPVISVFAGRYVVRSAKDCAKHCSSQLITAMQDETADVKVPD